MIDQQIREHVVRQVDAVAGSQGSITEVMRRGRRRRRVQKGTLVAVVTLSVVGVVAVAATLEPISPVADIDPSTGADRFVTVIPGEGPGDSADELAGLIGPIVVDGSASHVGSVDTPEGRFDIVTFTAIGEDPLREAELSTCVGVTTGTATSMEFRFSSGLCGPTGEMSVPSGGWGRSDLYYILDRMPTDTTMVIVTTSRGNTIAISATDFVFATWPTNWGPPETLTAYNSEWAETGFIDYTQQQSSEANRVSSRLLAGIH